jgi:indolepyruvate ferredoxin oxidoreductase, alpha subunit
MAERSFKAEVEHLKLGDGETFTGEGILAITKALLECGVGYVGGYQGAPISHLMDVLADAEEILVRTRRALRGQRIGGRGGGDAGGERALPDPGRGDLQGAGGRERRLDALANLSSAGVTGGALVIVGEDYGEGSSIMQETQPRLRDASRSSGCSTRGRTCPRSSRPSSTASSCPRRRTRR